MISPHGLKKLEALAADAVRRLKALSEEKARLERALAKSEAENFDLRSRVKRLASAASREARVRERLLKLSRKLDKIL